MNWITTLHVLFVFVWVGTLLSVTRLLASQAQEKGEGQKALRKVARRSYLYIDLPSMIVAVAAGIVLLCCKNIDFKAPWFHMKMTFVALLIGVDIYTGWQVTHLKEKGGAGRFKALHAVVGLLLIGILIAIYVMKRLF